MNILVIGVGGMIGDAVMARLPSDQNTVVAVSRSVSAQEKGGLICAYGDRAKPETILALVKRYKIDAVVDVVAYLPEETDRLVAILDGEVRHYVLLSSSDVYRNYGLLHRKETGAPTPGLLSEEAPLRTIWYPYRGETARGADDPDRWLDTYDKIPIEGVVRNMKANWTVLRLPMVFGPADRQRRFRWIVQPMLARADEIDIPQAWSDWTTTYGYVGNVAAAICDVVGDRRAFNAIFNVTDTPPVPHGVWIQRFADALGWQGKIRTTASEESALARATSALDLSVPLSLSGEKLHSALEFKAPFDLDEAIADTIAFERTFN